jgi:sugar/nucleoside kinase (ribokinase family)
MRAPLDLVVAGHVCLDITPSLPDGLPPDPARIFVPGRLLKIGAPTISAGGAVSNTGLAALRLGLRTALMGKVGDDDFGGLIRSLFAAAGAAEGLRTAAGDETSYTLVLVPPGLDRMFLHCPGCNDTFTAADIDYELAARARLFHFGYPPLMARFYADGGRELTEMLRRVRESGTATSLDMADPDPSSPAGEADWAGILERTLPHVDLCVPSVEEILFMLDRPLYERRKAELEGDLAEAMPPEEIRGLAERLLALGVRVALLKCGARGLYLRTAGRDAIAVLGRATPQDPAAWADRELWLPPYRVAVLNATGSGDCAIAGFLAGFLDGRGPEAALRLGCAAGARNVQTTDAISGMIPLAETEAYAATLSVTLPLALPPAEGWTQDPAGALWHGAADQS